MFFDYPSNRHRRIHGPGGYEDYRRYKDWLRDEFSFRCVYCLTRERWCPNWDDASFGVDHIYPKSVKAYAHLKCEYTNLVYCCNQCNRIKKVRTLFDPCKVAFGKILRVETDGRISGITPEGKTVVRYLRLNEESRVKYRRGLLRYHDAVVKNPNSELAEFFKTLMSYPDNLPDLSTLQPPTNSKPAGIAKSHLARKKRNELPQTY